MNIQLENGLAAQTTHRAMGTVMTHKAFGLNAKDSLEAVRRKVARIEGLLSRFLPESETSRINESAGIRSEKVSLETYHVLSKAVEFSRSFPGCFDVTIQPLVTLWHTAKESLAQPDASSIRQVLPLVDYRDLILDPWEITAGLYKWRANECQVTVSSGKVTDIQLIGSSDPGGKNTQHEALYDRVIQAQSLQVDTISGATLTSKAYLQCVENALIQAQHE
jgi:hypothetical protein